MNIELFRQVLDHGSVRLTAITTAVETTFDGKVMVEESLAHLDLLVVRGARTSYDAAWRAGSDDDKDERLIQRLLREGHTNPFEHASVTLEVVAPIFVFRQWFTHRTQSKSEMSARFCELPELFYVPALDKIGKQDPKEKQARNITTMTDEEHNLANMLARAMIGQNKSAFALYRELLRDGVPRELARTVLPVATYSKMVVTANLLNWMRFLGLRCDSHAQYEIRVYADAINELLRLCAPVSMRAFDKYWPTNVAGYVADLERQNAAQALRIEVLQQEVTRLAGPGTRSAGP